MIKTRDDELLKFKVIKEYFCKPSLSNSELYEYLSNDPQDFYQYSSKSFDFLKKNEGNDDLFHTVIRIQGENNEKKKVKSIKT